MSVASIPNPSRVSGRLNTIVAFTTL